MPVVSLKADMSVEHRVDKTEANLGDKGGFMTDVCVEEPGMDKTVADVVTAELGVNRTIWTDGLSSEWVGNIVDIVTLW